MWQLNKIPNFPENFVNNFKANKIMLKKIHYY